MKTLLWLSFVCSSIICCCPCTSSFYLWDMNCWYLIYLDLSSYILTSSFRLNENSSSNWDFKFLAIGGLDLWTLLASSCFCFSIYCNFYSFLACECFPYVRSLSSTYNGYMFKFSFLLRYLSLCLLRYLPCLFKCDCSMSLYWWIFSVFIMYTFYSFSCFHRILASWLLPLSVLALSDITGLPVTSFISSYFRMWTRSCLRL